MKVGNLLNRRDNNRKCPADYQLEEAKEGGTVDVDQEVYDSLHSC